LGDKAVMNFFTKSTLIYIVENNSSQKPSHLPNSFSLVSLFIFSRMSHVKSYGCRHNSKPDASQHSSQESNHGSDTICCYYAQQWWIIWNKKERNQERVETHI
jgi:hypothetical protein